MNRRNFLGSLGALVAAPVVVRASSLMPIVVPKTNLVVPEPGILIFCSRYGIERMRMDSNGNVWVSAKWVAPQHAM
jgi:hypothetical protein